MTTIAYKDGVIAYDSRFTQGDLITDDEGQKRIISGDRNYFCSGGIPDISVLVKLDNGGKEVITHSASALKVSKDQVHYVGMNRDDGYWTNPIPMDKPYAIGSGRDHALTAMDMGATAKEAVKMAAKRDTGTGGKIRTFKVK